MRELPVQALLHPQRAQQLRVDQQIVLQTVQRIIQDRRTTGAVGTINDLLDRMLTGIDRQSGEKLDDRNVMAQCLTFLIAGHETTSGLLSFALYELIKNREVLARGYDEVDRVLGTDLSVLPTYAQIHQVPYVAQILDETLRLWPTAPAITRRPYENAVIGGKYHLRKDDAAVILVPMLHRDKHIWGENPEQFDPDRFSPENRAKIPPNAYKPFGTGQRACIGRQFALQEATLVLSMLLQRFEFVDFAAYQLETKQTLTIKPNNFHVKVRLRAGCTASAPRSASRRVAVASQPAAVQAPTADAHQMPLLVLYGSNLGTAEGLAHTIAEDATKRGFVATVGSLDDQVGSLPKEGGEVFLDLLPPLRPRYYSISSSPLVASDTCSLTVGVLETPARSGQGRFKGICSNYLAGLPIDATVFGFVRKPTIPFRPPDNPHVPMIMVGPGTGVAPFRGFLQERAALKQRGVPVAESMLFFGCRDPLQDFLYEEEMRGFEAAGVTRLFPVFSREPGKPKTYVQQAIEDHSGDVWRLLQQEAVVFVCGEASRMAPDVRQTFATVFQERTGTTTADAQAWLTGLVASHRYLEDIWASAT